MNTSSLNRRATLVSSAVALALVALKFTVGIASGSVSVLASAIDSLLDFLVSMFNAYAVRGAEKPSDQDHNYGHGKLEGLAALIEGLFILASSVYVLHQAWLKLVNPKPFENTGLDLALGVMVVSLVASIGLTVYLKRAARKTGNLVLEADALHYSTDVWSNATILAGIVLIRFTGWTQADPLIAIAVGLYIAWAALPLLRKSIDMLMDHALPEQVVERIRLIAETHSPRARDVHALRTRRSGNVNFVDFHLVLDEHIPLGEAHEIGDQIEMRIRALENTRWEINIHLDPVDDSAMNLDRNPG
jgi:cation diffusion facilitator family transporter